MSNVTSARVTRVEGCLGYPRPCKWGLRLAFQKLLQAHQTSRNNKLSKKGFWLWLSIVWDTHKLTRYQCEEFSYLTNTKVYAHNKLEQILFIQIAKLKKFSTLKTHTFSINLEQKVYRRAPILLPCLIPCHRKNPQGNLGTLTISFMECVDVASFAWAVLNKIVPVLNFKFISPFYLPSPIKSTTTTDTTAATAATATTANTATIWVTDSLPFTWGNQLVYGLWKWKAKFPFEVGVYHLNNRPNLTKEPRTSLTSSKWRLRSLYGTRL